jgi:hypothetical protein
MASRPTANPSGALAVGTTTLFTGKCTLNSIQLVSDGTNTCSVTVYDNTAASGKIMALLKVAATTVPGQYLDLSNALKAEIGLTVVVAGTGATAYVGYGGA